MELDRMERNMLRRYWIGHRIGQLHVTEGSGGDPWLDVKRAKQAVLIKLITYSLNVFLTSRTIIIEPITVKLITKCPGLNSIHNVHSYYLFAMVRCNSQLLK